MVESPQLDHGNADSGSAVKASEGSPLRAALFGVAVVGVFAGTFDGLMRLVGIDPSLFLLQVERFGLVETLKMGWPRGTDLPGLGLCVARAGLVYGAVALLLGVLPAWFSARRSGASDGALRLPAALAVGAWLAASLYWWSRPVVFPGLPATDPKRLVAALVIGLVGLACGWLLVRIVMRRGRVAPVPGRVAIGIAVLGAAGALFEASQGEDRGALNERNRELPNVLFVIVDALRQDTLSAYGDDEVHTPHIDRLANEGVLFENAFAQAPFTWPSFGSFLTGKHPRRHGLIRMAPGVQFPLNATLPILLKMGVTAAGAQLVDSDWATGAFMTGTLSHGSGLLKGYDAYLEALVGHDLVDVHSRWSTFRSGLLPWLIGSKVSQRADRHLVTTTAQAWLTEQGDRRFMAMVHLYSTHTPYNPAPEFRERHLDPAYDGPFDSFVAAHREAIELGEYTPTEADITRVRRLYLAGVEEADAMIGRLVATLESTGALDNTIVIVSSDHGESLGEHGLWEHNWMYQDNLRIPLVMRFPPRLPAGARVTGIVDSIDVLPTVLDLAGITLPESAASVEADLLQRDGEIDSQSRRLWEAVDGRSLVPLARAEIESVRPYTFSENGLFLSVQDLEWKLIIRRELLRGSAWEDLLAGREETEAPRLYRVGDDPLELTERFDTGDAAAMAEARRLFEAVKEHSERMPIREDLVILGGRDLRAEDLFRGLGYADGVGDDTGEGDQDDE